MRRRRSLGFGPGIVIVAGLAMATAGCAGSKKVPSRTATSPSPPTVGFEKTSATHAMASVFAHPSAGPVPASIARFAASLTRGAPAGTPDLPGKIVVHQGRLLLSNLGPKHRAIYVFPAKNSEVCFVISGHGPARVRGGLGAGCKKAFIAGEPASMDGGTFYYPSTSGPPAEMAGLTEDGVTRVRVVLNGTPHNAVFGHNAWYYRFPTNQIPATAATKLLVTLSDGSTKTIPTRITKPPA